MRAHSSFRPSVFLGPPTETKGHPGLVPGLSSRLSDGANEGGSIARAGFCTACNANTWLNEDGPCVNGHPTSCVSAVHEAGQPQLVDDRVVPPRVSEKNASSMVSRIVLRHLFA